MLTLVIVRGMLFTVMTTMSSSSSCIGGVFMAVEGLSMSLFFVPCSFVAAQFNEIDILFVLTPECDPPVLAASGTLCLPVMSSRV